MKSTVGASNRCRASRDGRLPAQMNRWRLDHAPNVLPSITASLTPNSTGARTKALKKLVAWTSSFLSPSLLTSCPALLQFQNISLQMNVDTAKPGISFVGGQNLFLHFFLGSH